VPDAVEPGAVPIGARLRAARLAARKTMAEVASEAGLTKGFLSKLERDLANVSVASLMRLCDALGIPVGSLFEPPKGEVVRADERPPINFGGTGGMREYLLTPSAERRVQAIFSDIAPGGGSGHEQYSLPADVEFVFILQGTLEVTVEGTPVTLLRERRIPRRCSGSFPPPCQTTRATEAAAEFWQAEQRGLGGQGRIARLCQSA
jgi:transcriptional regulator with XRE-family HTH domain